MNAQTTESQTRRRILESARDLIYSRSYADVGVAAICKQAGVQKGSFYHFFASKQALTLEVIDEFIGEFKERIFDEAFSLKYTPMARFVRLNQRAYEFQKDMAEALGATLGCPFGNLAAEMSTQDEGIRGKVVAVFQIMEEHFRLTLTDALAEGEIDANTDVDATAKAMLAYIEGIMLMAKSQNDPEVIRTLGPAMLAIRIAKAD